MLIYPHINPIALHIGPLKIYWYGLLYLLSFFVGWLLIRYHARRLHYTLTPEELSDLIFYTALGVLLGGRLGYIIFYDLFQFLHQPWMVFAIWQGGMSFHGGFMGVAIALFCWARAHHHSFLQMTDLITPIVPFGLGAGRLGNFIGGELWGKITHVPWGMIYQHVDLNPRHPSQLYEFFLEGIILFIALWTFSSKKRPQCSVSGLFLIGYGIARSFCEFFRAPDPQWGYLAWGWLTMGQVLSFPMVILGIILLSLSYFKKRTVL